MNTLMLSSKSYKESKEHDFGDCFISDNGNDVVVFDCGSNEHAEKVIEYLENNYDPDKKAIIVLSHNDSDHFNGIPKLIEENKDLRIKDIADAVGFKEAYYFSKTFKRETGMWPTEYSARDK